MALVPYQLQYRNKLRKLILEIYYEFDKLIETKRTRKLENYLAQLEVAERELIQINYKFDFSDEDYQLTKQYFDKLVTLKESIESILMTNNYLTSIKHHDHLSKSSLWNFSSEETKQKMERPSSSNNIAANEADNGKLELNSIVDDLTSTVTATNSHTNDSSNFSQSLFGALNGKEHPDWSLFWILFDYYFHKSANVNLDDGEKLSNLLAAMPPSIKQTMSSNLFKVAVDYLQKQYPPAKTAQDGSTDTLCQKNDNEGDEEEEEEGDEDDDEEEEEEEVEDEDVSNNSLTSLSLSNDDSEDDIGDEEEDDDGREDSDESKKCQVSADDSGQKQQPHQQSFHHSDNEFSFCNSSKSTQLSSTKNGKANVNSDLMEQGMMVSPILDISWSKIKCLSMMDDSHSTISDLNEMNEKFSDCHLKCSSPFQQQLNGRNHLGAHSSSTSNSNNNNSPLVTDAVDERQQQSNQQPNLPDTLFGKKVALYGKKANDAIPHNSAQVTQTQTDQDKLAKMLEKLETNCQKKNTLSRLLEFQKNNLVNLGQSSSGSKVSGNRKVCKNSDVQLASVSQQSNNSSSNDLSAETLEQYFNLDSTKLSPSVLASSSNSGKSSKSRKKRHDYQRRCVLCDVKSHKTANCNQFSTASALRKRLKTLKRCYRCLSQDHYAKKCTETLCCGKCLNRHITILCRNNNSN